MRERMDTEEFAARVAAPLKGEVPLSAGFDAKVMAAVEEAAGPWWRRKRRLAVSPIGGLALAAGFGGLMLLAGIGYGRRAVAPAVAAASAPDTVHVVRFVFADPSARSVTVAGDFNGWSRTATPLVTEGAQGYWVASVTLPAGRHEYAFVVDGDRWVADPFASVVRDEFGQQSSVLRVGAGPSRGT